MPRDPEVQRVFEIADDKIQALWGYFHTVGSSFRYWRVEEVRQHVPEIIDLTHDWDRNYNRDEMLAELERAFPECHTRLCVIGLADAFSVALSDWAARLAALQVIQAPNRGYKPHLEWALRELQIPVFPDHRACARVPTDFLDVDHCRRIRNACAHQNGQCGEFYVHGALTVGALTPLVHASVAAAVNAGREAPVKLLPGEYQPLSKSHVELLHVLHHELQFRYFGETEQYEYRTARRPIMWRRILTGQ